MLNLIISFSRNKLQSNSKLNRDGDHLNGQSFNLPNLKYYMRYQACDFLRSFDLTARNIRQSLLNHSKFRLNYISSLPESVCPITINLIKDSVALLELTFEYSVWY